MRRRVVVTGLGLVTPLGCGVEEVWRRLLAGESGVTAPRRYGAEHPPTRAVGEVSDEEVRAALAPYGREPEGDRRTRYGYAAGRAALADAGISPGSHPRGGVALASGPGAHRLADVAPWLDASGRFDAARFAHDVARRDAPSHVQADAERPAVLLARDMGLEGPVFAITTACSAANQAIGSAIREIRSGRADWMVAGGADTRNNPAGLVWFVLVGAGATEAGDPAAACRPFDVQRTGLVIGEGAGCAVLESEEHARARGARIYAEAAGYASTLDAWRATAPHPEGRGIAEAMTRALRDAGVGPDEVDFVSAHGTGTKRNDPAEARAIHAVFGARGPRVAVSSGKSMMGHLLAAAAGVSFATAVLAAERDTVPPTINVRNPDPACDLDVVRGAARRMPVRAALVNSLAFGGQNACVVVRKWRP